MKRAIVLAVLAAAAAAAQTATVTGTMTDPAGDLLSGSCSIQAMGPFSAATGWRVTGAPMVVAFSGGLFSAALAPTDSATPSGQYYKAICAVPKQTVNGRTVGPYSWGPRYWLVPTNTRALDIGTVEITSPPPSPSWQILWQQMAHNGATPGQSPVWNGSSWLPGFAQLSFTTSPADGQYLRWNASQTAWQPVTFVDQETPSGTIDGANATFTLANAPNPASGLVLFRNGLAQQLGTSGDFTLSGNTITFCAACMPQPGDVLTAWYRY